MKGPNPFAPYEKDPDSLCGRKEEIKIFSDFAAEAAMKHAGVLLIEGGPGLGKSALIARLRLDGGKMGMLCPLAKAERGQSERGIVSNLFYDSSVGEKNAPDTFIQLISLLERNARGFGAIVFIDDIDAMRKPREVLEAICAIARKSWGRGRVAFVVSSMIGIDIESDILRVAELAPFSEHDAKELVDKALKKGPPKMGEECLGAILSDSGGNPKLLRMVCRYVYENLKDGEKVITKGHYLSNTQYIMNMLGREWFGRVYQETPFSEREILSVLAEREEMHVSDVAKEIGKNLGPITALMKRLLDSGQITRIDRGKYKVFSKLYARYIILRG